MTIDPSAESEAIAQQQELLAIHRRTLAHYLRQHKAMGIIAQPSITNGIHECWTNIEQIKTALRASVIEVPDESNDEPRELTITMLTLTTQERRNRNRMLQKVRDFWVKGVLEKSL